MELQVRMLNWLVCQSTLYSLNLNKHHSAQASRSWQAHRQDQKQEKLPTLLAAAALLTPAPWQAMRQMRLVRTSQLMMTTSLAGAHPVAMEGSERGVGGS